MQSCGESLKGLRDCYGSFPWSGLGGGVADALLTRQMVPE
jgi:hypothetical protein